jgi:hypothetical protein
MYTLVHLPTKTHYGFHINTNYEKSPKTYIYCFSTFSDAKRIGDRLATFKSKMNRFPTRFEINAYTDDGLIDALEEDIWIDKIENIFMNTLYLHGLGTCLVDTQIKDGNVYINDIDLIMDYPNIYQMIHLLNSYYA